MALPLMAIGAGVQALSGLFGALSRKRLAKQQMKMAGQINPVYNPYQTSQYALQNRDLAMNAMNGRMAGAAAAEQGIQTAQMNTINAANRNATSSADALAVAAASQGNANEAATNLAVQEARHRQAQMQNVMNANQALVGEDHMKHQDMWNKYLMDDAKKQSLMYASMQNRASGNQGLANLGMIAGNALMGAAGDQLNNWLDGRAADRQFAAFPMATRYSQAGLSN